MSEKLTNKKLEKLIDYWLKSAIEDRKTSSVMFEHKRFAPSLFYLHLSIEKILKTLVVQRQKIIPPLSHDLVRLSHLAGLELNQDRLQLLRIINRFNIRARYDDYKLQFYKQATKSYSEKYIKKGDKLFLWIKSNIQKKK